MRRFALCSVAAMLVGCAKSESRPAADTTAAAPAAAAPAAEGPAPISLADIAGKWKLKTTDEAGKNVVESQFTATADTTGWKLTRPNGKSLPMHVTVSGDSIIT